MTPLPFQLSPSKLLHMTTEDKRYYSIIANDHALVLRFANEIGKLTTCAKLEDTLRRFNLSRDGKVDFEEYRLALMRMGIESDIHHLHSLFQLFSSRTRGKLDIELFCKTMQVWKSMLQYKEEQDVSLAHDSSDKDEERPQNMNSVKRVYDVLIANADRLEMIFAQIDIDRTGYISEQELELAFKHIGVLISETEQKLFYKTLPEGMFIADNGSHRTVNYMLLLDVLPREGSKVRQSRSRRLWEMIRFAGDILKTHLKPYEKTLHSTISPGQFRDCLRRSGILMSETDYLSLQTKLNRFSDSNGSLRVKDLIAAIEEEENNSVADCNRMGEVSPFPPDTNFPKTAREKSTKEIENRLLKGRTQTDSNIYHLITQNDSSEGPQDNTSFKSRLVDKLEQLNPSQRRDTVLKLFPGDSYGAISRGQLCQGLSQLGVNARYSDVETLFWTLGEGHTGTFNVEKLYNYLLHSSNYRNDVKLDVSHDDFVEKPLVRQRLVDNILSKASRVVELCKKKDTQSVGIVSQAEFLSIVQECGILLSSRDAKYILQCLRSNDADHTGITYNDFASRLKKKTSETVNPFLTPAGIILQQDHVENVPNANKAVSPRRGPPGRKTTIDLTFNPMKVNEQIRKPINRQNPRQREIEQCISMLIQQKTQLKAAFNRISTPGKDGLVERNDIIRALCSARLDVFVDSNLAQDILVSVLPQEINTIGFDSFYDHLSLANTARKEQQHVEVRLPESNNSSMIPEPAVMTLRQKILTKSRLLDLTSGSGQQTAAVILRRAFRMVCPSSGPRGEGQFDGSSRKKDMYHILNRVGIEITPDEFQYLCRRLGMESNADGSFTSSDLLTLLVQIANPISKDK